MAESTQHKLDRVRPPRVQITYDVEIGDAIEKKSLPLVVGVMADLSGKPAEAPPVLKKRKFVQIDRDNFNDVMKAAAPRLELDVDNKLSADGGRLKVEISYERMMASAQKGEDPPAGLDMFSPIHIIRQVEPLHRLLEARKHLDDLLTKLDGNDDLDRLLQDVLKSTEKLKQLSPAPDPDAA
ncbi:MAG: type VI secretion system contractile sheath small subunit [Longimicrobiaceae bacterium]